MGGCEKTEDKIRYKNIIQCIRKGHKRGSKHSPEKFSWGAPADQETNELLEEIEERLKEEEELEGQYKEETLIKKIEMTHCKDHTGPTKIDS